VPIADAQKVMGHESPQTLLGIYTHVQNGARDRITGALAASLPLEPVSGLADEPGEAKLSPDQGRNAGGPKWT
jgi:hypothetical protein